MRISDWSSDVCSSDLPPSHGSPGLADRQGQTPCHRCGRNQRRRHQDRPPEARSSQASAWKHPPVFQMGRSEEHTSELQSLMRISYAVFCLKKKNNTTPNLKQHTYTTPSNKAHMYISTIQ